MKKTEFGKDKRSGYLRRETHFREPLATFWRNLEGDQCWRYEELSPIELLEQLELHSGPACNNELDRTNWFWRRQPRLLLAASWIVWFVVALGLPFWIFMFPWIGVPLLIMAVMMVLIAIVQSMQWRREYELSVDRLIRASTNGRDTSGRDVRL